MNTLKQFSEKERNDDDYQARQNFLREQRTIQRELESALEREARAVAERNDAMTENNDLLAQIARLKALLEEQGKQ
jgi:hypothetical protein